MDTGLPLSPNIGSLCLRAGGNGYPVGSNLSTLPAFSPDGRFIVFGWQIAWEWWADLLPGECVDDNTLAKVGKHQMGVFEIIDWETRTVRQLPVIVDLPPGWYPPGHGGPREELMADPAFIDQVHFQFMLPTSKTRVYRVAHRN